MIIPDFLKPGDNVAVVATAKKVNRENTLKGIEILKSWKLNVVLGKNIFNSYHQFAGTDAERIADFQEMINDPEIKAIFAARGGYGSTRIIDQIDFGPLKENPKWICGFSDITAIHLHLNKLGICGIHSPMPSFFYSMKKKQLHWLRELIFGEHKKLSIDHHALNKPGQVSAKLIGGNLSLICHTIGTLSEIETNGNILFIEDVGEKLYHLDRMMIQLNRAGFLKNLAGLIVCQFTEMEDDGESFGFNANEIIHAHVEGYNYPVAFNFPIGHIKENYAVPVGMEVYLEVNDLGSVLNIGD